MSWTGSAQGIWRDPWFWYVRSKHLKSQCLLYWKYSKLLCIRTLIKLSYHTSSVEAVHSKVIFFFYDNIQLFLSFLLNFYSTFFICHCFGTEIFMSKMKSIKLLLLLINKALHLPRNVLMPDFFVPWRILKDPKDFPESSSVFYLFLAAMFWYPAAPNAISLFIMIGIELLGFHTRRTKLRTSQVWALSHAQ